MATGSARKTQPRHSVRDICIVASGMGLLRVLKSALPMLDLVTSAAGKKTAPAALTIDPLPRGQKLRASVGRMFSNSSTCGLLRTGLWLWRPA